jgi:hypothetical protein
MREKKHTLAGSDPVVKLFKILNIRKLDLKLGEEQLIDIRLQFYVRVIYSTDSSASNRES